MNLFHRLWGFVRREAVLCIAALCAALSMLIVPPGPGLPDCIDLRVLCLLWCLMLVVAGLTGCGLFSVLAQRLLAGRKSLRLLALLLVLLPFFTAMLITNDVALITFVPFAVFLLTLAKREDLLAYIVVLQTVAANLGSMATPVGNPQNLYLYAHYNMTPGAFLGVMLPLTLVSLALLLLLCLRVRGDTVLVTFSQPARLQSPRRMAALGLLFALCLLSVFRLLHFAAAAAAVLLYALLFDRPLLKQADYGLLLTFVCFFVFSGNLGQSPAVRAFLAALMDKSALYTALLSSQVISNVPAALLLSGFTQDWRGLLAGVNLGGLGTPIASLASLISLKLCLRAKGVRPGRYLAVFSLWNLVFLAVLLAFQAVFLRL